MYICIHIYASIYVYIYTQLLFIQGGEVINTLRPLRMKKTQFGNGSLIKYDSEVLYVVTMGVRAFEGHDVLPEFVHSVICIGIPS